MGGGPSREEREASARLQRQQADALATQNRLLTRAETPDPLAERIRQSHTSWLDAVEGRSGPFNVETLPGMAPYLDLWNRSRSRREGERMGTGALRLGAANQNPEIAARIAEQKQVEREQEAGGNLENTFRLKDAEVRGSVLPLLGLQQSRDLGLAGIGSSNYTNATNAYLQFLTRQRTPSFWSQLALGSLQAGSTIAAAAI